MSTEVELTSHKVQTDRLLMSYLTAGNPANACVVLVHGNVTSNLFWKETIGHLCKRFYVVAPDMRGYGETEALPIDATRGMKDWANDLAGFVQALGLRNPVHLIGWSLGAGIVMQYAIDSPATVATLTLISPLSPFGFGATKSADGEPNYADFAGSGGGTVNPEFVRRIAVGDRTADDPNSPRNVMNQFYFRPPFRAADDMEEKFVDSMLTTRTGDGFYPGSLVESLNWPGVAPGPDGIANAMSPRYVNLSAISDIDPQCPVLWVRGDSDQIVSDKSLLDFGTLGKLGAVPDWPGEDVFPSQPMVSQTRHVLELYKDKGGSYEEFVVNEAGHSPHIERPDVVLPKIMHFFTENS